MRKNIALPRILKIQEKSGLKLKVMFNNGETRLLDFAEIFNKWNVGKKDAEYPLLNETEFQKVELRNYTLSWKNIELKLLDENGEEQTHPYELSPDLLYEWSEPTEPEKYGNLVKAARRKAGLTQDQLAQRSGTTRFYISRLENNRTDVELSTFRKIVEAGLGKKFRLVIE